MNTSGAHVILPRLSSLAHYRITWDPLPEFWHLSIFFADSRKMKHKEKAGMTHHKPLCLLKKILKKYSAINCLLLHCPVWPIIPLFSSRDYKITIAPKLRVQQQRDSTLRTKHFVFGLLVLVFFFRMKFRPLNSHSFKILPHHL